MDNEQLKRIADAIEEILRLVKEDQERSKKYMEEKKDEQETRNTNGQGLPWPRALARGSRSQLQAASRKLQATSCKLDKTTL